MICSYLPVILIKMVTTRTRTDYEFNAAVNQKPANRKLTRSPGTTSVCFLCSNR